MLILSTVSISYHNQHESPIQYLETYRAGLWVWALVTNTNTQHIYETIEHFDLSQYLTKNNLIYACSPIKHLYTINYICLLTLARPE
jgi:hypothetical protein